MKPRQTKRSGKHPRPSIKLVLHFPPYEATPQKGAGPETVGIPVKGPPELADSVELVDPADLTIPPSFLMMIDIPAAKIANVATMDH